MKLKAEFEYYRAHQAELVKRYGGKVIAIIGEEVFGPYESDLAAVNAMLGMGRKPGTFFIQRCEPGEENYTQHFRSRVSFA
jgi:hypothetical protein